MPLPPEYEGKFDIITFKSVLGGIGSYGNIEREKKVVEAVKFMLKDNGYLILIENMQATWLHKVLREHFSGCGRRWHYHTDNDIENLFSEKDFMLEKKAHYGFLVLLGGKCETARRFLGYVDYFFDLLLPEKAKYVEVFVYMLR